MKAMKRQLMKAGDKELAAVNKNTIVNPAITEKIISFFWNFTLNPASIFYPLKLDI